MSRKTRMGPWDLDHALYEQVNLIHLKERKTWRNLLTEGCRLLIASRGMEPGVPLMGGVFVPPVPVYPDYPVAGVSAVSAPAVEVMPVDSVDSVVTSSVVGVSAVSAPAVEVLPVVVPTQAEKDLKWCRDRVERHKARIVEANEKLARNPEDVQALKQLSTSEHSLPGAEIDLVEAENALAAEKAAKENSGEVETMADV
jgi:hypothetical protein